MGASVLGVESMIVVEVPGTGDQIPEGLGSIGRKSEILDISDGVCQSRFSESKRKREEAEEGFQFHCIDVCGLIRKKACGSEE